MNEIFVKKYWEEEDILFFMHFENSDAIRQVEIRPDNKIYLDIQNPIQGESILYDQKLDELDLNDEDFIQRKYLIKLGKKRFYKAFFPSSPSKIHKPKAILYP